MKKKLKIYLLTILTSSGFYLKLNAQSPIKDNNWQLNSAMSDEFNGTSLNTSLWQALDCYSLIGCNWGGSSAFSSQNVSVSNGVLHLKCDGPSTQGYCFNYPPLTVGYKTAGIWSLNFNYYYGYIEIYAILPGFVNVNGNAHADKFWPALWTYHQIFSGGTEIDHDEIDIMDECCSIYKDAKTTGSGYSDSVAGVGVFQYKTSSTPLCLNYHKYAVEWNTDRMKFYFDDNPYLQIYKPISMNPMRAVLDFQLMADQDNSGNVYPFYSGTPFPQYLNIDYFRYYQLKKDCNTDAIINNNTDLSNFVFAVKRNITIGNGSTTIYLNAGDNKTFRATNETTINGEFTVPIGSELSIIPTPCN